MLVIPAIDVRGGRIVRLVQGDFERETVYGSDVLAQATAFAAAGARRLHVVDLDAARGQGDNRSLVERLVAETGVAVQVAGGVRSKADVDHWLSAGAAAAVMGTAAVLSPATLLEAAAAYPDRVMAALDVKSGRPAVTAWDMVAEIGLGDILQRWTPGRLGGVILTSVDRDGTLEGPDLELLAEVRTAASWPVIYSGGISSLDDIRLVAAAGAGGVILGKSLLEGRFSLSQALSLS